MDPDPAVTPCRLYVLPALQAPLALVLRRGPTDWWHLLQWDLAQLTLTPGAWFRGTLYPRRCDVSADGRLFGYFAAKRTLQDPAWPGEYFAVSRSPWLKALAAWPTCGTWTWGCRFSPSGDLEIRACMSREPHHGSYPRRVTVGPMSCDWLERDIWNELKRGWTTDPGSFGPGLTLRRPRPGGPPLSLGLVHHGVDFRRPGMEGVQLEYFLQDAADIAPLAGVTWADWDVEGRLLMATSSGTLAVSRCHSTGLELLWTHDLSDLTPHPQPAPSWSERW